MTGVLPWSVRNTLAQLRSGQCQLLNTYKAHITNSISDGTTLCRTSV